MRHLLDTCTAHHINFGGGCLNCGAMPDRSTVKVTTSDGDSWVSTINLSLEDARAYYMGQRFAKMNLDESESIRAPVVSVELVQ